MPSLPDASVDMILADPPYATTQCKWDSLIPLGPMWEQLRRVIRQRGAIVMTAAQPFASALVASNREWFRYEWVWVKGNPSGHLNAKKRPLLQHESVLVFADEMPNYWPQMRKGRMRTKGTLTQKSDCYGDQRGNVVVNDQYYPTTVLAFDNSHKTARVHPTQKPVAMMEYLISTYTREDETVLDFCMGSGTTGIACLQTGRKFIGIELEPYYYALASRQIAEEMPLFAPEMEG